MHDVRFYQFLHKQIPILIALSVVPGLGYLFLGWLHDLFLPAFIWYQLIIIESLWGWYLYRTANFDAMSEQRRQRWYYQLKGFFYSFFLLWVVIFLIYVGESEAKLHYIAIFTELGAAAVAAALLNSDRRLYRPVILILMTPLIIYFFLIGEWYSYILTIFAAIFTWVLLYSAYSSHQLLMQASYQANHDTLTGLQNRHFLIDHLQKRISSLQASHHYSFMLLIDLDHFKTVNDTLGHDIGDHLLRSVGERLRESITSEYVVARLGGDEFMVIGPLFAERQQCSRHALQIAERLLDRLKDIYIIERHHLYISASIGISLISDRDNNANRFIKEADIAMYEVKAHGRDGVFIFDDQMSQRVETHLEIERLLHFALDNDEISLAYQPQLDRQGRIIGVESLVRWHNSQLGSVPPDQFIPIAEQTGLIIELSNHILETAFRTLRSWHDSGVVLEQFSVNISMRQFNHQGFTAQVEHLCRRHLGEELSRKVIFEVTESVFAEDINRVVSMMQQLQQLGIRFSMDDFGTGYSSLNYLARLPIDELKIDRSFISALGQEESDKMVSTIINLANFFELKVVAEGVENEAQHQFLLHHHCDYFQGYLFAKPLSSDAFAAFYREQR